MSRRKLYLNRNQQEQEGQEDKSIIPAPERFEEVLKASETPQVKPIRKNKLILSSPATYASSGDPLQDAVDEGARLREAPIERKNGRVKSAIIRALNGASQMAREGIRTGHRNPLLLAAGGAIGGAASGSIDDLQDERAERQEAIAKNEERQGFLLKSRKEMAGIKAVETMNKLREAQAESYDGTQDVKARAALMRELQNRMKVTGGKFDPADARSVELARELEITPRNKPAGINWQRVRQVTVHGRDHLVFLDFDEQGDLVFRRINAEGGVEDFPADEQREIQNAIALEQANANRARNGQAPLMINPEITKPGFSRQPAESGVAGQRVAPAPVLIPTGEPAPEKPRSNYGRRRGAERRRSNQSSSSTGLDKYEEGSLRRAENDAAQSRARAAAARSRGDEDEAKAHEEAARVAEETASKLRAKKGGRRASDRSAADPFNVFGRMKQ